MMLLLIILCVHACAHARQTNPHWVSVKGLEQSLGKHKQTNNHNNHSSNDNSTNHNTKAVLAKFKKELAYVKSNVNLDNFTSRDSVISMFITSIIITSILLLLLVLLLDRLMFLRNAQKGQPGAARPG